MTLETESVFTTIGNYYCRIVTAASSRISVTFMVEASGILSIQVLQELKDAEKVT
jgi:hypothetical protein